MRGEDVGVLLETYQKLISEYNNLYDHYVCQKQKIAKFKQKLQDSNTREHRCL